MPPTWFQKFGFLGTFAGALAFYFLLALVPLFILSATVVYQVLQVDITPQVRELLRELLPASLAQTPQRVADAVAVGTSRGWFTLGFIGVLWASASFMNELARAIHLLFADVLDAGAGGWRRWLKSLLLMVLWCGMLVLACMLFLFSTRLPELARQWPWLEGAALVFVQVGRWLATLGLLATAVMLTLRLVPSSPPTWKHCTGCGLVVALVWMFMGAGLTRVLPLIWAQSPLPIAFGSFLVIMFWAYACCWVLLLGALVASRWK